MQTESQTAQENEAGPSRQSPPNENGALPDPCSAPGSSLGSPPASLPAATAAAAPVKKPTRQWDAWTRQEEENFFIALRQVGKNFEKITSRVQSKNKDQVRHYYYRLIKRMNKLLGPGFALDAKNSKDANAAMLRWWSLLEKHSCSASKLHLKPRRFKTFVTALGHQLLKDRKKTKRKQPSQNAAAPSTSGVTAVGANKVVVNDSESVKVLSNEAQSVQKPGPGRGATVKRNGGSHTGRGKGEASSSKPPRQRRKAADAPVSSAAYKRWEKAASAGVTLVAEAAEQLERASIAEQFPSEHGDLHSPSSQQSPVSVSVGMCLPKRKNGQTQASIMKACPQSSSLALGFEEPGKLVAEGRVGDKSLLSTSSRCRNTAVQATGTAKSNGVACHGVTMQPLLQPGQMFESLLKNTADCYNSRVVERTESAVVKLKLQLFPIDEFTRKALEKDGHNPHLELTLKARKMISSVLQHLMQKWGRSTVASGELMLFPYNAQRKDLHNCERWTMKDTNASAGDVHVAVGSPSIFRLRYGWLPSRVLEISNAELCQQPAPGLSQMDTSESCLQCDNERTVKLRRLDMGRSAAMYTQENESGRFYDTSALNISCSGNLTNFTEAEMPCHHLATQGLCVYTDSARSITLPLESAQSTAHMSTVISVKAPAVPPMQPASLSHEINRKKVAAKVDNSGRFIPSSMKMVEGNCMEIEQEKRASPPAICPGVVEQTLENSVPEKICRAPEITSQIPGSSWLHEESSDGFVQRLWDDEGNQRSNNGVLLSTMDWVDSLTNISVGDLLNEASRTDHGNSYECLPGSTGTRSQQILQYMDSFDAAIAAHVLRSQGVANMPIHENQTSIWDGEETCDAFAFQKNPFSAQEIGPVKRAVEQSCCQEFTMTSMGLTGSLERFVLGTTTSEEVACVEDLKACSCPIEESQDGTGIRQFTANELYWADSLGSLDMGIRPSGVQGQDLITGDISISLSGLVASSLDAFQNCSFLGSDKKVSTTVNNQDQPAHAPFCTKENGKNNPLVTGNENREIGRTVISEALPIFGMVLGDSDGGGKQATNCGYGGSMSSEFVEASGLDVNNKLVQEQILSGSNDSFTLQNACNRADSEAKVLPLVGASV
eukprot:Gb_34306 [translate_table: standard]